MNDILLLIIFIIIIFLLNRKGTSSSILNKKKGGNASYASYALYIGGAILAGSVLYLVRLALDHLFGEKWWNRQMNIEEEND